MIRGRPARREIEAHGEIGKRRDSEIDRIAQQGRSPGSMVQPGFPLKGARGRSRDDRRILGAQRDVRGADPAGRAECVLELDAQAASADADARDHPYGLVLEAGAGTWRGRGCLALAAVSGPRRRAINSAVAQRRYPMFLRGGERGGEQKQQWSSEISSVSLQDYNPPARLSPRGGV